MNSNTPYRPNISLTWTRFGTHNVGADRIDIPKLFQTNGQ